MTPDRPALISFARGLAGLSAAGPTRAAYLDLIAPGETPARAAEMACNSGCELTCMAILRHFIDHPRLKGPYPAGQAGVILWTIGHEAGAIRPHGEDPEPGDMLIVGGGEDGGGTEHAFTCVDVCRAGYSGVLLVTGIDGGQRSAAPGTDGRGAQCILERAHDIVDGFDSCGVSRRKVRVVINSALVIERFGR